MEKVLKGVKVLSFVLLVYSLVTITLIIMGYFTYKRIAVMDFVPILYVISAIGLLKLKNWVRIFTIIVSVIIPIQIIRVLILSKVDLFMSGFFIGPIILCIISVYYLTRPKVKEQFK
jgi:hypothetical protein